VAYSVYPLTWRTGSAPFLKRTWQIILATKYHRASYQSLLPVELQQWLLTIPKRIPRCRATPAIFPRSTGSTTCSAGHMTPIDPTEDKTLAVKSRKESTAMAPLNSPSPFSCSAGPAVEHAVTKGLGDGPYLSKCLSWKIRVL
jgi:hypothetical protein